MARAWDNVTVEAGYRNLREENDGSAAGDSDSHMAFASASRRLTDRATATLSHSQILSGEGIDRYETETSAGLEYRLTEAVKASVVGNWQWTGGKRHAVLFGLETRVAKSTVLTSRYEIEDTVSGERLQSLIGLNHLWSPRRALKLDGRVEWIDYQKGTDDTGTPRRRRASRRRWPPSTCPERTSRRPGGRRSGFGTWRTRSCFPSGRAGRSVRTWAFWRG